MAIIIVQKAKKALFYGIFENNFWKSVTEVSSSFSWFMQSVNILSDTSLSNVMSKLSLNFFSKTGFREEI